MDVSKLEGAELDLEVSKLIPYLNRCEIEEDGVCWEQFPVDTSGKGDGRRVLAQEFKPSTNWHQGGPLIEAHKIWVSYEENEPGRNWIASCMPHMGEAIHSGSTPLIAAMRALVASKPKDS